VYVSDKPGHHDFSLLRLLVLPDGSILRAHVSRVLQVTRVQLQQWATKATLYMLALLWEQKEGATQGGPPDKLRVS
jgi:hypothetical protein